MSNPYYGPISDDDCRQALIAVKELGTIRAAAKHLGLADSTLRRRLGKAKQRGLMEEGAWRTPVAVPEDKEMVLTTVQYDADGNPVREWRRLRDAEEEAKHAAALKELAAAAKRTARPKIPKPAINKSGKGRMLEIPIGDLHLGCRAWGEETGEDYDLAIGQKLLINGVKHLLSTAGPVEQILVENLGDLFHADNRNGQSERSGHTFDVDSRYSKVIRAGVKVMTQVIDMCASVAPVHVVNAPGNHDWHSEQWLPLVLDAYYRNSQHITIAQEPRERHYYQWEDILIGTTHGHLQKAVDLVGIMAQEQPQLWGACQFRAWRCGHIHHAFRHRHDDVDEHQGVVVEYYPVLAGRDAWHTAMGYHARRILQGIVWEKGVGETERYTAHARRLLN